MRLIDADTLKEYCMRASKSDDDFSLEKFETLWDSTVKKSDLDRYGWDANPYVFVIEFVKIDKPEEIQNA